MLASYVEVGPAQPGAEVAASRPEVSVLLPDHLQHQLPGCLKEEKRRTSSCLHVSLSTEETRGLLTTTHLTSFIAHKFACFSPEFSLQSKNEFLLRNRVLKGFSPNSDFRSELFQIVPHIKEASVDLHRFQVEDSGLMRALWHRLVPDWP